MTPGNLQVCSGVWKISNTQYIFTYPAPGSFLDRNQMDHGIDAVYISGDEGVNGCCGKKFILV
jgi:hypothetical protein